jgi:hypothetical protein
MDGRALVALALAGLTVAAEVRKRGSGATVRPGRDYTAFRKSKLQQMAGSGDPRAADQLERREFAWAEFHEKSEALAGLTVAAEVRKRGSGATVRPGRDYTAFRKSKLQQMAGSGDPRAADQLERREFAWAEFHEKSERLHGDGSRAMVRPGWTTAGGMSPGIYVLRHPAETTYRAIFRVTKDGRFEELDYWAGEWKPKGKQWLLPSSERSSSGEIVVEKVRPTDLPEKYQRYTSLPQDALRTSDEPYSKSPDAYWLARVRAYLDDHEAPALEDFGPEYTPGRPRFDRFYAQWRSNPEGLANQLVQEFEGAL